MNIITVNEQIVSSMHTFGVVFMIAALVTAAVSVAAALSKERKNAAYVIRSIFFSCLAYALILFGLAWLFA